MPADPGHLLIEGLAGQVLRDRGAPAGDDLRGKLCPQPALEHLGVPVGCQRGGTLGGDPQATSPQPGAAAAAEVARVAVTVRDGHGCRPSARADRIAERPHRILVGDPGHDVDAPCTLAVKRCHIGQLAQTMPSSSASSLPVPAEG